MGRIRTTLHFGSEFWELAVLLVLLSTGAAGRLERQVSGWTERKWLRAIIFCMLLAAILFLTSDLPIAAIGHAWSLYYGISVQSWPSWMVDQLKMLALAILLETPALMLVWGLMRWPWSRQWYWFWFAIAAIPTMILAVFLLPEIVEPLFETFTPLAQSHPALVQQLERVVARTGIDIPPSRMFLMKASEKSNGLNAYVTGIGSTKRIVVWDTTADRMPQDEVLFTFAHESGHYVLNHIPKGLALASVGMFPFFWATSWLADRLIHRFSNPWQTQTVASLPGLVVLLLAFAILQMITEPLQNFVSRYAEHQADVYGQEAIHGIVSDPQHTAVAAFNDLGVAYLDDPNPNPFLEFWTYDHPSIQTRATFASHYNPWQSDEQPLFLKK